jgi:hypothetical protein
VAAPPLDPDSPGGGHLGARPALASPEGLETQGKGSLARSSGHRFLTLLERLGHSRPERATPYEVLDSLPADLQWLEAPARTLTDLYVLAAYSAEPVERGAGDEAVRALREIRGLLESQAA